MLQTLSTAHWVPTDVSPALEVTWKAHPEFSRPDRTLVVVVVVVDAILPREVVSARTGHLARGGDTGGGASPGNL